MRIPVVMRNQSDMKTNPAMTGSVRCTIAQPSARSVFACVISLILELNQRLPQYLSSTSSLIV